MPSSTETYRLIKVPAYGNCGPQALAESVVALIQNTDYKIPKDTYKEIIRAFQDFLAKLKTDSFVDKFLPDMKFDNAWANPTKEQEARKALTTAEKVFKENPSWDNFEYILRQVSISEADKHALCIVLAIGLRKLGVEKAIEAEQKKNGETSDASTREYLIKLEKQFENSEPVYNDVLEEAAKLLNLGLQMVGVLDEVPPSSETTGTQSKIYKINEEYKQQPLVNGDGKAGTIVVQYTENPKHFNPLIPSSFSSAVATSVSNSADSESRSKIVSSNLRKVIYGGSHIMPNQSKPTSTGAGASAALAATPVFSHNLNPLTPTSRADTPVTGASKSDASGNSQFPYSPTIIAPNPQDGYSKLRHEPIFAPTPPPTANSSLFDDAFNQLITALNRAGFSYKLVNTSGISQGSIAQYTHGFYNITRYSEAVGRCLFEPLNIATIDSSKNQTLNVLRHILSGMQCASINQNNDSLLSDDNTTLNIISEIASSINERKSVNLSLRLQQLYYIGLDSEIRNLQNAINSFTANKTYTAFVKKISEKCSQLAQNLPSISEQLLSTDECFSKISLEYQEICKEILQELQQNVPNLQYDKLQERLNLCKTKIDQFPDYVQGKTVNTAEYQKLIQPYKNIAELNKRFSKHVNQENGKNEDMVLGQLVSDAVDDLLKIQSQFVTIEASLEKLEQKLKPVPRVGASPADDNDIQSTQSLDSSTTTQKRKELEPVVNPANAPSALFNQGSTKADAEKPAFTISPASQQKQDSTEDSAAKRQKTGEKDTVKDHTDKIWTKEKYTTALGKLSKMAGSGDINISKNTKSVDEIIAESTGESLNFELAVKGTALKKSTCTLSPDGSVKLKNANFANSANNDQKQTGYKNLLQVFKEFPGNASEKAVIEINDMPLADVELLLIAAKNIKLDLANVTVPNVEFAEALKQAIMEHHLDYSPNIIQVKQEPVVAVPEGEKQAPKLA